MLRSLSLFLVLGQIHKAISTPSVIIVGAGPAGIAAATKLLENSITNVTILEVEDRIGGRIRSVKFGDAFVDVGAEFCHGEEGNIVYELAKNLDVLKPGLKSFYTNVYYSNGSKIDSLITEEIELFSSEYEYSDDGDFDRSGKSTGNLFIHKYNASILKKYENNAEKLKIFREGMRFSEGGVLSLEGSFSWFDSSATTNYQMCEGDQTLGWNGRGYKTILEILMKSYPDPTKKLPIDDKIHLNKKVTKINWNDSHLVTVHMLDNSSYSADYLIFTPSIGVLKKAQKSLFNPQLPPKKQSAIEAIGFGAVIKTFFYFPTKWWKDDDQIFSFYWSEEDIKAIDFPDGPTRNGLSWIIQFRSIIKAPNNPNVFTGWITGDLVPEIEKIPLETLKRGCMYVMRKFLGRSYNITEIGRIMRSTWYSNENFGGVYSFTKTGTYKKDLSYPANLAEPLTGVTGKPVLLFAGEATNPIHHSTVHGAIETGHREAERIINLNK